MSDQISDLSGLGWTAFYSSQLDANDLATGVPVRVTEVHRSRIHIIGPGIESDLPPYRASDDDEDVATVGDWLMLDRETGRVRWRLGRRSLFKRRAPGTGRKLQLIAANVDTLFIVTSCNQDFKIARLERYLALAREADVTPVVVLTKADLSDTADEYADAVTKALPGVFTETLDARDPQSAGRLAVWCGRGQTVAFVGSSGVGKSTLINSLLGDAAIATQGIREDDAKGRHTTTGRALYRLGSGGWLMDTPGMRELQLTDVQDGLDDVFSDVTTLAHSCRFADCRHDGEPGCAVEAAIAAGELDPVRLAHFNKLMAEEAFNSATLAERRQRGKAFGKMVKQVMKDKRHFRERE
ncbi:MAG: ribosome small subunit-dependent GTPase A [Hyphomicrobiales bacterium]|nr:MAG: ribosome small subunit-dependent GTPase A [Hyphomicrobiales bacterium]